MSPEINSLKPLLVLFGQAEVKIKQVEQTTGEGVLLPSINQLRYAGYHIVKSLLADDEQKNQAEIDRATNHAKRAIYDIDEALLIDCLDRAKIFKEKYGDSVFITDIIANYPEQLIELDKANQGIQNLRKNAENYKNRHTLYQQLEPHLETLSKIIAIFEQSAHLIAKKEEDKKSREITNTRRFQLTIIVALFIGIIGIYISM